MSAKNIFFLLGLAAIVLMIVTLDVSFLTLWEAIEKAGYWLVAILLLWAVLYAGNALSWRIILGKGVPFWRLYRITISGFALNNATPVGLLGGEPYKIVATKDQVGIQRATSSVVLFSMMHVVTHLIFWATSVPLYLIMAWMGMAPMNTMMKIALPLILVFTSSALWFFAKGYRYGLAVKGVGWLTHVPYLKKWAKRMLTEKREDLLKIDQQIADLHKGSRKRFYGALVCELIGRIGISLEVMMMILLLDEATFGWAVFWQSYLIMALTSLLGNMLFFFPSQVGGREGGFVGSAILLGFTGSVGVFVAILSRVREIVWDVIGIALIKMDKQ